MHNIFQTYATGSSIESSVRHSSGSARTDIILPYTTNNGLKTSDLSEKVSKGMRNTILSSFQKSKNWNNDNFNHLKRWVPIVV